MCTEESFFYTLLGFTQSNSGVLGDIEGFIQLIPDTYKNKRPTNFTGIGKSHLKCDAYNGSIANGVREPILYSFGLTSTPGHKIYKKPRIKFLLNKIKKNLF